MGDVVLSLLLAAVLKASALEPSVLFVTSFSPYRVTVREHCEHGICRSVATVEKLEAERLSSPACSADTIAFPSGEVMTSRWSIDSGSPVLFIRVRTDSGRPSAEAQFRLYADCTSTLAIDSEAT